MIGISQELISDCVVDTSLTTWPRSTPEGEYQYLQGRIEEYEIEVSKIEGWLEIAKDELAAFVSQNPEFESRINVST